MGLARSYGSYARRAGFGQSTRKEMTQVAALIIRQKTSERELLTVGGQPQISGALRVLGFWASRTRTQ